MVTQKKPQENLFSIYGCKQQGNNDVKKGANYVKTSKYALGISREEKIVGVVKVMDGKWMWRIGF